MTGVAAAEQRNRPQPGVAEKDTEPRLARIRYRRWAAVVAAVLGFGALTVAVFLDRAGAPGAANWPTHFDLLNSDNGVLYQFSQDVFRGRSLQWQFSPQVYVFPEMPMSLAAYALAGGSVYGYYLWIAVLNNCALFGAVFAVVRLVRREWRLRDRLWLTFLASSPFVVLPLLSAAEVFEYHLAPTYYIGAYIFTILTPVIAFAPSTVVRVLVGIGYALTAASDPLLFAFSLPAVAVVIVVCYLRDGVPAIVRPGAWMLGAVIGGWLIRTIFLQQYAPLAPSAYISIDRFADRLHSLAFMISHGFPGHIDTALRDAGLAAFALTVPAAIVCLRAFFVRSPGTPANSDPTAVAGRTDEAALTIIWALLVPTTSVLALFCSLVLHMYYIWLAAVGSTVFLLLLLNRRAVTRIGPVVLGLLVVALALPPSVGHFERLDRYFGNRPALTRCLDREVPQGDTFGFATLSDARHYELTSRRGLVLAQILGRPGLNPNTWLANKAYYTEYAGTFFLVNPRTQEPPIRGEYVTSLFGRPQLIRRCGAASLFIYTTPAIQQAIRTYYRKQG